MKKALSLILSILMILAVVPLQVFAESNTEERDESIKSPAKLTSIDGVYYHEIYTIEDLYNVRDDLTANYIFMNDIDLTEATAKGGAWDYDGRGWNPIGSGDIYSGGAFSGIFDGNGYSVIGMRIDITSLPSGTNDVYVGLFSKIVGVVKNLTISGKINVELSTLDKTLYVGTFSGGCSGNIDNCRGETEILTSCFKQSSYIGGIVGYLTLGSIKNSMNNGFIKGEGYFKKGSRLSGSVVQVGGIAGKSLQGTVLKCYNIGEIKSICGEYDYTMWPNYNGADYYYIKAYSSGIVGYSSDAKISDCYNFANISSIHNNGRGGYTYSAGISYNTATIENCYNVETVSKTATGNNYAIGYGTITESYYLSGTGGGSTGATSLSEAQTKLETMYKGFDFENTWIINPYANYPYPQLRSNVQDLTEAAELVSVIAIPTKTTYFIGDKLDFTDSMIKVVYKSGREEIVEISEDMVSGFDSNTVGEQTLTVTVAGKSDTYTINVIERPGVIDVTIISQPNMTKFVVGTSFDFTGAKALVTYEGEIEETVELTTDNVSGGDINHIGKYTITYTAGEKSASFEVEVVGVSTEKLVIKTLPQKLTYLEGESLDLSGIALTAVMNNGMEKKVEKGYTVSGYSSEPGTHTVIIMYQNKTASFDVVVKEKSLVSLELKNLPDKLEYIAGQKIDPTGMELIAVYDNGDVLNATDYTISDLEEVVGSQTVTVSLEGKSVSFTVNIIERVETDFKIVSLPAKLNYVEGESLNMTGLKAEVTFNDEIIEEVTDYDILGSTKVGIQTIYVSYKGFIQSFEINVSKKVLKGIEVKVSEKTTYYVGDDFDKSSITVTASYNNGQKIEVNDYTLIGFESETAGVKMLTVSYGEFTYKFLITVEEALPTEIIIIGTVYFGEKTTVAEVKAYYDKNNVTVSVMEKDEKEMSDNSIVGTGNIVVDEKRNGYTIIVKGDVDGNGIIDSTDYLKIKSYFLNLITLDEVYFTAADTDDSGAIDSTDYLRVKSYFLGSLEF